MELHGSVLLRNGGSRGVRWMMASQLLLLAVIFGYVAWRLKNIDIAPMRPLVTDQQREAIANLGMTVDHFLRLVYKGSYAIFALVSLIYQGGLALYYHRRRAVIDTALHDRGDA